MSGDKKNLQPLASRVIPHNKVPVPTHSQPSSGIVTRVVDQLTPNSGRMLFFIWIITLVSGGLIFVSLQGKSTQFFGIAESREQSISFQHPVELVSVSVVEGEEVIRGQKLIEVRRYDLDAELVIVGEKIGEIDVRREQISLAVNAEIASLSAQEQAESARFSTEIKSLEARYRLNRALVDSLSENAEVNKNVNSSSSPLLAKLNGLKAEQKHTGRILRAKIENLEKKLQAERGSWSAQTAELKKQRAELNRQVAALVVHAEFAGSVGSVLFRPGEQVSSFEPVISLHATNTNFVKGYIHEALVNDIKVGKTVWVKSLGLTKVNQLLSGSVESLGSRIVEYPDRLKKSPLVSAWGREAVIRLNHSNHLLLGEKVMILLEQPRPILTPIYALLEPWLPVGNGLAAESTADAFEQEAIPLEYHSNASENRGFEASGIVSDPNSDAYLVVIDEAIEKQANIFQMDKDGKILRATVIATEDEIDDLESISTDGETIFVLSSLAHNRKGKLKYKHRQLMRLEYTATGAVNKDSVDLYKILKKISRDERVNADTRQFLRQAINRKKVEIEAHAVVKDTLYLGFKNLNEKNSQSIILALTNIDALFSGSYEHAGVWRSLSLIDPETGLKTLMTDMVFLSGKIYLLSVIKNQQHHASFLWRYDVASSQLSHIRTFPKLSAEGISVNADQSRASVVFDGGKSGQSYFLNLEI